MTNTPHTLARQMSLAFESGTRPTGETFRRLKDGSPEWMTTVCRKAHDDARLLPDDWRYAFIEGAVDALAEHEDRDEARSSLEPDIYTSELTGWLHSLNSRVYYVGEALSEYGSFRDGFQLLAAAQMIEKEEVFQQVVAALEELNDKEPVQFPPELAELYTYLDNNYVRFDDFGCLVALTNDRETIFWCPLYNGDPDREGDHMNWGEVTAPEPEFVEAVNKVFGTAFRYESFAGR